MGRRPEDSKCIPVPSTVLIFSVAHLQVVPDESGFLLLTPAVITLAALASLLVPASAPWLLVCSALFPLEHTRLDPDVLVLAGLMAGSGVALLRRHEVGTLRRFAHPGWLPFLFLAIVALASAVVNGGSYSPTDRARLFSDTKWFIFRMAAVGVVSVSLYGRVTRAAAWIAPIVWGAAILALLRILQSAGLELTAWISDTWGILVFSDMRVEGWQNGYGSYVALALPLAIGSAIVSDNTRRHGVYWAVAFILALGFVGVQSRAAALVIFIELACWFALWPSVAHRIRLGVLGAVFVVVFTFDPDFLPKSSLIAPEYALASDFNAVKAGTLRLIPGAAAHETEFDGTKTGIWRAPLVAPEHALRQKVRIRQPGPSHSVHMLVRRGLDARGVRLVLTLNGRVVATIRDLPELRPEWISVPLTQPIHGEWATIEVTAAGRLDAARNYIEVGGVSVLSDDVLSSYRNGPWTWTSDLSWDPGTQAGVFLILLDERTIRGVTSLPAGTRPLDQSITDRVTLWRAALRLAREHPWAGTGYYTFAKASAASWAGEPRFFAYANTHNAFLQMASDLGFPGFVGFAAIFAVLLGGIGWEILRRPKDVRLLSLGLAVWSVLLTSLMQTWFADVRYTVPVWVLFGCVAGLCFERRVRSSEPARPNIGVNVERRPAGDPAADRRGSAPASDR
jgi:hypothetical protein